MEEELAGFSNVKLNPELDLYFDLWKVVELVRRRRRYLGWLSSFRLAMPLPWSWERVFSMVDISAPAQLKLARM